MYPLNAQCDLPVGWDPTTFVYNVSASSSSMPATLTAEDVEIQTPFDIDQNATWSNCKVGVTDGDAITVKSGNTLVIQNGTLVTTKADAWSGIVVENGATLVFAGYSIICRAETAITVNITSSGDVTVSNSDFIQNYRGMLISAYTAGVHPASIQGARFFGGYPTALPSGLPTTYGSIGLEVVGVNDGGSPTTLGLVVGNPGANWNLFQDLDRGIVATNSTLWVRHTEFKNIFDVNPPLTGIGILGAVQGTSTPDMLIGTSVANLNVFGDCQTGIRLTGFNEVTITDNVLSLVTGDFHSGIEVFDTQGELIIRENDLSDFDESGIYLEDNGLSSLLVKDNEVSSTAVGCTITAIELVEPMATGSVSFAVRDNIIDDVQMGIRATNTEDIEISGNTITFTQPFGCSGDLAFGIRVEGAINGLIEENTADGLCSACNNPEIIGIAARNSLGVLFRADTVLHCGFGFLVADDCEEGNAVCNVVINCNKGFGFQSVATGEEFGPVENVSSMGDPSDNAWFPASTANRTYTFAITFGPPFVWWYRGAGSTPAAGTEHDASIDNTSAMMGDEIAPQPVLNANIDLCGQVMCSSGDSERAIAHSVIPTSILNKLREDSTLNTVSNSSYSYLQVAKLRGQDETVVTHLLSLTIIAALDAIEKLVQLNELENASIGLSTISPINTQEDLQKGVLSLLIAGKQVQMETFTAAEPRVLSYLSNDQISDLESIASLDATGYGIAVLMAKAILGINDWSVEGFLEKAFSQDGLVSDELKIYPNPSKGLVYFEAIEPIALIQVFDAHGQLQIVRSVTSEMGIHHLDLSNLQSGIYLINATASISSKVFSATLVIAPN